MRSAISNKVFITGTWALIALVLNVFMNKSLMETLIAIMAVTVLISLSYSLKRGLRVTGYTLLTMFYILSLTVIVKESALWLNQLLL